MSAVGVRRRFWPEVALAIASAVLGVVTLISKEWIEIVFGVDLDGRSGALEWLIVAGLAVSALVFGALAGAEYRRAQPSAT